MHPIRGIARSMLAALILVSLASGLPGCGGAVARSAAQGNTAAVKQRLAQGEHVDSTDWKKRSPLELSIILKQHEVMDLLIKEGADVNRRGKGTRTPLIWASMQWGSPEVIHKLIDSGADPNRPDAAGQTPLFFAALYGTPEQMKALIQRGADVNHVMKPKWRAPVLAAAIRHKKLQAVEFLVAAGADLKIPDAKGRDARQQAAQRGGNMLYAIDRGLERLGSGTVLASNTTGMRSSAPKAAAKPKPTRPSKAKPTPKPKAKPKPKPVTTAKVEPAPVPRPAPRVQPVPVVQPKTTASPRTAPRPAPLVAPAPAQQIARVAPNRAARELRLGEYHALVIGNDDYPHLPKLRTAVNDAKSLSQLLEKRYGYSVTTLLNASRSEILQALTRYRRLLTEQDNLLIYYAGHGWLDEEADRGYWLPVDATQEDDVQWIANETITSKTRAIEAKHVMIIADSCYSGKLVRGIHVNQNTPNYLKRLATRRARVVLTSGGIEPVSDGGGRDNHSVFATALLRALEENDGVLEGHELFTQVRRPVAVNSDQIPEYSDIRKAGHDGGDFLFIVP